MADSIPTFRRLGSGLSDFWAGFSYADSIVARGGAWTLICWLPMTLIFVLPSSYFEALVQSPSAGFGVTSLFFLPLFPGSLLIGFVVSCVLAGRPANFLDSLKRGLQGVAMLVCGLLVMAMSILASEDQKAGLLAVIILWVAIGAALAGMFGGFLRWVGNRPLPPEPAPGEGPGAAPAGQAGADWLASVAEELSGAGLFDYATALAVHKALQASGRAAADALPPLEAKYEEIFAKLQPLFPDKKREDWLEANARLRQAMLMTAKAGGGVKAARAALRDTCPNLSDAFYEWLADRARQLP
jgi:hypothetical protein